MLVRSDCFGVLLLAAIAAALLPGCGCTGSTNPGEGPLPEGDPRELLEKVFAAYAKAESYRDKGTYRLRYQVEGETLDEATQVSLSFHRPTRLRFNIDRPSQQIAIASDGKQIQAKCNQADSKDFDEQFVARPILGELTVGHVDRATDYRDLTRPNQMISLLAGMRINLEELPLALLLAKKPLPHLLGEGAKLRYLPDHGHGGKEVRRVALTTDHGEYVFWIDPEKLTLVQLEFPANHILEEIAAAATGKVQDVTLTLDLAEVELGAKVDEKEFKLDAEGAAPQQYFIQRPRPLPTPVFGKDIGDLELREVAGKPMPRESFNGKVTVMMWWDNQPASKLALQQLDFVYQKYRDNPRLAFWAVCTEPASVEPGKIAAILKSWKIQIPPARDLKQTGREQLEIKQPPALVVTDTEGKVQVFELGLDHELSNRLPPALERLLQGDKLAKEAIAQHERDRDDFIRALAISRGEEVALPPAPVHEVPAKTNPEKMKLAKAWICTDVKAPGNFLVVANPGTEPAVLVLEGKRTVVQLNAQGEVKTRLPLPIPAGAEVTFLRTAVDGQGKRYYAACGFHGRQLFVFDDQWKFLFSYPDLAQPHEGIVDVLLADLAGDGEMQCYAGFWGLAGTHGVDLQGKRVWSNRTAMPVLSLTSIPAVDNERQLIVTSDRGLLLPLAAGGREVPALQVKDRPIHQLVAASFPAPRVSGYLGLSFKPDGELAAHALTDSFGVAWDYPLPKGNHQTPIEFLTSANFGLTGSGGEWLIAGPDGSLHVVSDNGNFFDSFYTGKTLTGLAGIKAGGKRLILLASQEGIEALEIVEAK